VFSPHLPFVPRRSRLVLMARTVTASSKTRQNSHNHLRLSVHLDPRRAIATKLPLTTRMIITTLSLTPHLPLPLFIHYITKTIALRQRITCHRGPSKTSVFKLPAALRRGRSGKQNSWMVQKSVSSLLSTDLGTTNSCALSRVRFAFC